MYSTHPRFVYSLARLFSSAACKSKLKPKLKLKSKKLKHSDALTFAAGAPDFYDASNALLWQTLPWESCLKAGVVIENELPSLVSPVYSTLGFDCSSDFNSDFNQEDNGGLDFDQYPFSV